MFLLQKYLEANNPVMFLIVFNGLLRIWRAAVGSRNAGPPFEQFFACVIFVKKNFNEAQRIFVCSRGRCYCFCQLIFRSYLFICTTVSINILKREMMKFIFKRVQEGCNDPSIVWGLPQVPQRSCVLAGTLWERPYLLGEVITDMLCVVTSPSK